MRIVRKTRWAIAAPLLLALGSCNMPPPVAVQAPPPSPPPSPPPVSDGTSLSGPDSAEKQLSPDDILLEGVSIQGGVMLGAVPANVIALTLDGTPVTLADDGRFLLAFDRDAPSGSVLRATTRGGQILERSLSIAPRQWNIERVNVLQNAGKTNAEFERLRGPELEQINAARRIVSDSQGWRQGFIWPVKGRISGLFGAQRIYRDGAAGSYHSGVDVAGATGTPFVAPADGVVILAAATPFTLEGYLLMIDHGMGLNSAFLHCSELAVKTGDVVKQGQYIGRVGATGRATGPHLHWGMKWGAARIDPLLLAGEM